jgi:transposase
VSTSALHETKMEILDTHCAGLDVHKKSVVACRLTRDAQGNPLQQIQTFTTMTADLLKLSDWLQEAGVTHVAMESTGVYWQPVYNLLEAEFTMLLVNPRHFKNVPGRKTDVKDAQWLAELLQVGLLQASFVPPAPQRQLRELVRYRSTLIGERANLCNRIQKLLEGANIKLASVATDVLGVSGRAMLKALVAGERDPQILAELAKGRLRNKKALLEQALLGRFTDSQGFILAHLLSLIDALEESIEAFDQKIESNCLPFEKAVEHLDTIPGVGQSVAEVIVSELGTDMSAFPTPAQAAAWAGVAPGNRESAGKRLSGRVRAGNHALRTALLQAAHAAARQKDTYLAAQYRQIAYRRGPKKAALAVAHSILVIAYRLIQREEDYVEAGGDYFDKRRPDATVRRLTLRLEQLGYQVLPNPQTAAQAA